MQGALFDATKDVTVKNRGDFAREGEKEVDDDDNDEDDDKKRRRSDDNDND